jgi:serine/threonine protein kinase/Flp pilus assembly protein TadD
MTPERWRRITEVFHLARTREATARAALLDDVCADDVALRADVESMLAADAAAVRFDEAPLFAPATPPQLQAGACLGPYHIKTLLGAGGMGEVYRAHDARLDRDVAIKVLSATTVRGPDARLVREARSAASLNHPHICTIYEVGETAGHAYIAMELIDGTPLDQQIPAGGLPVEDLLRYAIQIADAIAHAHERGIVHRDLKPANVIVSASGIAKVLDFGVAKVLPLGEQSRLEITASQTAVELIAGTAAYMSPEQALGHSTDARSDVFSFGALLYEMTTGRPAFIGGTPTEVLGAVLHARPEPVSLVRQDLPGSLSLVIDKALAKDPSQRYQHMSGLAADLHRVAVPTSRITRAVATSAVAATMAVIGALIWNAVPTSFDRVSIDNATGSRHQETMSLPAYRAITEARGLYAANRWEAALELTQRALDLDPDYAEAWAMLGKIYVRLASPPGFPGGSLEDYRIHALTAAKRAVELDPSSYDGHVALALAYREMTQIDFCRVAARKAIALDPQSAEAYAVLGDSYSESTAWGCGHDRDRTVAISHYRRARSIDPSSHVYHINLSQNSKYAGQFEEALRVADEGLRVHPTSRGLRRARAWMLIELGRLDEAERVLREAIADGGARGDDQLNFATIDLKRGRLQSAGDGFRKAVPRGGHSRRFLEIARHYVEAGLPTPALPYLEQILEAEPACGRFLLTTQAPYWSSIRASSQARAVLERYSTR